MAITGLMGTKEGMTRVFTEDGASVPVTVVRILPNRVVSLGEEVDGKVAVTVAYGQEKPLAKLSKAVAGQYRAANIEGGQGLRTFLADASDIANEAPEEVTTEEVLDGESTASAQEADEEKSEQTQESAAEEAEAPIDNTIRLGGAIGITRFEVDQWVDVAAVSKGKGFQGGVKRHNFTMQPATHGNSISHRAIGSTGQCQDPGKVFKGKKMPGQMGNTRVTVQNLRVIAVDRGRNVLLIRGAVPGAPGSLVEVRQAVKKKNKEQKEGDK